MGSLDPKTSRGVTHGVELAGLRDRHPGERIWLLGNGPSLNEWTTDDIVRLGGSTLGINRSWQRFSRTDYHCLVAGAALTALLEGHVQARVAFVPKHLRWLFHDSKFSGEPCFVRHGGSRLNFNGDICHRGFVGTFAGLMALQLAAHMGFSQIVLLGFDGRSSDGHFYAPNVRGGRDHMVKALLPASEWLDSIGVEVLNAHPGSAIPWWPRFTRTQLENHLSLHCGDA